jgi:hypothetical protein
VCRGLSPPSECAMPGAQKQKARPNGRAFAQFPNPSVPVFSVPVFSVPSSLGPCLLVP